ncbi:MAG: Lrp/AsnC ligand binding domain-containing protein [Candidatus Bathyarchaeota archaeon]|nr:Lrp/AsnC ligand binding domain-containing protein [Candidatus Bathyarchaeota archaeon]MDH5746517.1 Lrp/AsnC ligand binding domain-containing protein [Candidatus Bathyarchaeota archaeon]
MVVSAYTLIRTEHSKRDELVNKIKKLRFVKEIASVYGEYDIVVKTETNSIEELNLFIYNELRKISGLATTTTMITFRKK